MKETLDQSIAVQLAATLHAHGFEKLSSSYEKEAFGNETVIYRSRTLDLRFSTDRGDLSVAVRPSGRQSQWILLDTLLAVLDIDVPHATSTQDTLAMLNRLLPQHVKKMQEALSPSSFEATRALVAEQRRRCIAEFEQSMLGKQEQS